MKITHNEVIFKVGSRVKIKSTFQDDQPLRMQVLTIQYHRLDQSLGDPRDLFVDNVLYTDAMILVGGFANWELELVNESEA